MTEIYKAIDLQTGKEKYINFKDDYFLLNKIDTSENIIKTISDNKYYKITEEVDCFNGKPDLCLSYGDWNYNYNLDVIKIHFYLNDKGYSYFIDKELKAQIKDVIVRQPIFIKTPYGDKDILTIEDRDITETDWRNATKLLELSDKEIEKRIIIKYWDRQKGTLNTAAYQYLIDKKVKIKENTFYTIIPNNQLVYVQKVTEGLKAKSSTLLRKTLINPKERIESFSNEEREAFLIFCGSRDISLPSNFEVSTAQENFEPESIELNKNNKGENNMNTNKIFKNLEFGKISTDAIKFSINGLAFRQSDGTYVTYNAQNNEFTDVTAFVMDTDFMFAVPVAAKDLKAGDIIKHQNKYVIVAGYHDDNTIKAIDPLAGEEKVVIPVKNLFGFNYYTKIVNIFAGMETTPSEDNPFGNLMPFLMMQNGNTDNSLMLAMMMTQNGKTADFMNNPFMMMALLNKEGK